MEWIWVLLLAAPLLGPILWALVRGRRLGSPKDDDALEAGSQMASWKDISDQRNNSGM